VGKLYLPGNGRFFGCRHCNNLTYTICQKSGQYNTLYRYMAEQGYTKDDIKGVMKRWGK